MKLFESFWYPLVNYEIIQVKNAFIETIPNRVWNKDRMNKAVMDKYREPFSSPKSRKALRKFPEMLPIGENLETFEIFKQIEAALAALDVPVLLLKVDPGALINERKMILSVIGW